MEFFNSKMKEKNTESLKGKKYTNQKKLSMPKTVSEKDFKARHVSKERRTLHRS